MIDLFYSIIFTDTKQNHKTRADAANGFFLYGDLCPADKLNYGSHVVLYLVPAEVACYVLQNSHGGKGGCFRPQNSFAQ